MHFFSIMFFFLIYTAIFFVFIGVSISSFNISRFSKMNPHAIEEYNWAVQAIKQDLDIENQLVFCKLKYRGMIADNNSLKILYHVVHPYTVYLEDKEKYGISMSSWSGNVKSLRDYEKEPLQTFRLPSYHRGEKFEPTQESSPSPETPFIIF